MCKRIVHSGTIKAIAPGFSIKCKNKSQWELLSTAEFLLLPVNRQAGIRTVTPFG